MWKKIKELFEKPREERFDFSKNMISGHIKYHDELIEFSILDISKNGLSFCSSFKFKKGEKIELSLDNIDSTFKATVVWCQHYCDNCGYSESSQFNFFKTGLISEEKNQFLPLIQHILTNSTTIKSKDKVCQITAY